MSRFALFTQSRAQRSGARALIGAIGRAPHCALATGLCLTLGLALGLPGLRAQETQAMYATIPFDFWIGQKLLPSGNYLIDLTGDKIVFREERDRQTAAVFLTIPESRFAPPETGELVFHRYADEYFLAGVWTPVSKDGRSVPKTSREKRVAASVGGGAQTASVRLR